MTITCEAFPRQNFINSAKVIIREMLQLAWSNKRRCEPTNWKFVFGTENFLVSRFTYKIEFKKCKKIFDHK